MIGKTFDDFWTEDSRWGDADSYLSEGILARDTWKFVCKAILERLASENSYWSKQLYDKRQLTGASDAEDRVVLFITMLEREIGDMLNTADAE